MTKKKKIKKLPELPRQACYPYRVGQKVHIISWKDELFATGIITESFCVAVLNEPETFNYYKIKCKNGEEYPFVPERDVFLSKALLFEEIKMHLAVSDEEFEEED